MTTINNSMSAMPAFTANLKRNDSQNDHSGLKVGAGVAAVATLPAMGAKAGTDRLTKFIANAARKTIAEQNKTIQEQEAKIAENFKNYGKMSEEINKTHKEIIELAEQIKDNQYKQASEMFKTRKIAKSTNFKKALILALPVYLGAGAIVDYFNNKQRENSEPNAKTKKGNPYVKADMGKRIGFGTGVAAEILLYALNKNAQETAKKAGKRYFLSGLVMAGIGGYLLGALTDRISNKKAAKAADLNA